MLLTHWLRSVIDEYGLIYGLRSDRQIWMPVPKVSSRRGCSYQIAEQDHRPGKCMRMGSANTRDWPKVPPPHQHWQNKVSTRAENFAVFPRPCQTTVDKKRGAFRAPLFACSSRYQLPLNPDTKLQGVEGYIISTLIPVPSDIISASADLIHAVVSPLYT